MFEHLLPNETQCNISYIYILIKTNQDLCGANIAVPCCCGGTFDENTPS